LAYEVPDFATAVSIVAAEVTLNVAVQGVVDVNLVSQSATISVNVTNATINIVAQGGMIDQLQVNEGVLKAYNMKSRQASALESQDVTILTVPSGRVYYIVSAFLAGVNTGGSAAGIQGAILYGYNKQTNENFQFFQGYSMPGQSFNVTVPFSVAIRLPANSTVKLQTSANARAVAGVLFIDVPAALDSYFLEPILNLGRRLKELAQLAEEEEVE
jgi:hypothetical protein